MKTKHFLLFGLLIMLVSCDTVKKSGEASPSEASMENWLTGSWKGSGYLTQDKGTWDIEVTGNRSGEIKVKYPDQGCGGRWEIIKIRSSKIEVKEVNEYGEACLDEMEIEVKKTADNAVELFYYNDLISRKLLAKGEMKKIRE